MGIVGNTAANICKNYTKRIIQVYINVCVCVKGNGRNTLLKTNVLGRYSLERRRWHAACSERPGIRQNVRRSAAGN